MESRGRRAFLGTLAHVAAAFTGGCSLGAGGADDATGPETVRTIDPVRTDGDPLRVARVDWSDDELVHLLRDTVSGRSECLAGDLPVVASGSRLTITMRAVIPSTENVNVYFPGNAYYHLKRIAPRSITLSSPDNSTSEHVAVPVFLEAVLLEGDREESVPSTTGECPVEPNGERAD